MKTWFPFTDYDFYAYITAGMLLIAAADYTFGGGVLTARTEWTVVQITFWTAIAYLTGQLVAAPSSAILEHFVARTALHPPSDLILGLSKLRRRERMIRWLFASREYAPLPKSFREGIIKAASNSLGLQPSDIQSGEDVFGVAYGIARSSTDAVARMDQFRNLYGFSRNVSFVGFLAVGLLIAKLFTAPSDHHLWWLLIGALILAVGMFGRFLKFYAAFSREVFSAFGAKIAEDSIAGVKQ